MRPYVESLIGAAKHSANGRRRLTPRSSRASPACGVSPVCGTPYIFTNRAYTARLRGRLSSNVMPQKSGANTPLLTDIRNSQFKLFSGSWRSRAVGIVAFARGMAVCRMVSRVAPGLGGKTIVLVGPAAQEVAWPIAAGFARRSVSVAQRRAGLSVRAQSSSLGRPPWGALACFRLEQGGRLGVRGNRKAVLPELGLLRVAGKVHLARRRWLRHNTSLKRSAFGRPPVPGLLHTVHFHRPGTVVLPLSSA
jgi:hypothetical protein